MKRNLLTIMLAFFVAFGLNAQEKVLFKAVKSANSSADAVKTAKDVLNYDGDNSTAIGTGAAADFETSARFPQAMMTPYIGQGVHEVQYFINGATDVSAINIKIYGEGTATTPGALLYEEAGTVNEGWNNFILAVPVVILDGDLWVGYQIVTTGGYPAGCDAGPNDPDGQWTYMGGIWQLLTDLNAALTYNWNIRAVVDIIPSGVNGGVTALTAPVTAPGLTAAEDVIISIINAGDVDISSFEVGYNINGGADIEETYTGTITPGNSAPYTFATQADLSTPATDYNFKCWVTVAADINTANDTLMATVRNTFGDYCDASGGGDEFIDGVVLVDISNTGTGSNGYEDFTGLSTDLDQGQTYTITITNGNSYASDDLGVWIDFNDDGDFYDADENVICTVDDGADGDYDLVIPGTVDLGQHRMRIRIKYNGSDCGDPCGATSWGEVEDYTVNILGGGATYSVTFNVDMNPLTSFDPLTQEVYVSGGDLAAGGIGAYERWAEPGTNADFLMTDVDVDGIYTLVLTGVSAGDYEYKYFWIDTGTPSWDNGYPDANASFSVVDADVVLNDIWTVGIEELTAKGISVYPNPSNGIFNVNVKNNFNLEVLDITGKVINTQVLTGNSTVEINSAGVYFFRFSNENGSITQRVIVQ